MITRVRGPAVQAVTKTFFSAQVQLIDRSETIQPAEQNPSCNIEEIKDVIVPSVTKEVLEVVKRIPQESVKKCAVKQTGDRSKTVDCK